MHGATFPETNHKSNFVKYVAVHSAIDANYWTCMSYKENILELISGVFKAGPFKMFVFKSD